MKKEAFDTAMNYLDTDLIDSHMRDRSTHHMRARRRRQYTAATAACVAVVLVGVGATMVWDHLNVHYDEPTHEMNDVVIAEDYVTIRYITADGQIREVRQYLRCDAYSIFAAWRTQNGLGEEVKLIRTHTASNGIEWTDEFEGEGVVGYRPGDKFYLTITVEGLAPYLETVTGDILLESLKQTLGGYTGMVYESIEVILQ